MMIKSLTVVTVALTAFQVQASISATEFAQKLQAMGGSADDTRYKITTVTPQTRYQVVPQILTAFDKLSDLNMQQADEISADPNWATIDQTLIGDAWTNVISAEISMLDSLVAKKDVLKRSSVSIHLSLGTYKAAANFLADRVSSAVHSDQVKYKVGKASSQLNIAFSGALETYA
ncbi:hypothetical protein PT974_07866 [Cladobotryum mycophilum]|uniref:Uncharacterized protein n=1 Tax=Cladobotryum mycophilum TaxID=491253 RepID=A0ABR0SCP7_9HYPO